MINKDNLFVIRAHVAPLYSKSTFTSSKISEATFGEQLKVLNVKGSWLNIMQEDGYKGWIKDFYGTFEKLKKAFIQYADNIPFYGFISICADHKNLKSLIKKMTNKKVITFGLSKNAGISAKNIEVIEKDEVFYTKFDLSIFSLFLLCYWLRF